MTKSPGCNALHVRILQESSSVIAYPLNMIFDCSFDLKRLLMDWLSADVAVIYKKGNKSELGNYRPVSLTSTFCKMLKSIMRDLKSRLLKWKKLFSSKQFGFIKGQSTVTQLLTVLDKWTESLETGGQVDVICTDFVKLLIKFCIDNW